ncbi:unnamed protein product [Malus baccata var. baccata]
MLRSYPGELSLIAFTSFWGLVQYLPFSWNGKTLMQSELVSPQAILSGDNYYVMGVVHKEKGPIYHSSFNPLGTVTTAIMGSLVLAEQMYFKRRPINFR